MAKPVFLYFIYFKLSHLTMTAYKNDIVEHIKPVNKLEQIRKMETDLAALYKCESVTIINIVKLN